MDNLTPIIKDLNKAVEIREKLKDLSTKTSDPVIEIIEYVLDYNIISSTSDILKVSRNIPEDIADLLSKKYDEKVNNSLNNFKYNDRYKYAGHYKNIEELNAKFGTDFNYRCIPEGAIVDSIPSLRRC